MGDEVGHSVFPCVENPDLVLLETGDLESRKDYRLTQCGSRQAIQARPDHPNIVVSPKDLESNM